MEIKQLRKKLCLTQSDLAKKANISQSLIAKIESGKIDPSYTKTKKILETLNLLAETRDVKAMDVMKKVVIAVGPEDHVKKAIEFMKKHAISQLPVIANGRIIGMISETTILNNLDKDVKRERVGDIMESAPPVIARETSIAVVSGLLKHFPMVVVAEKGNVEGIITKADVLNSLK